MIAPVILFVYNRLSESIRMIEALQQNILAKESVVYIYSDGAKNLLVEEKVRQVREFVKTIDGFKEIIIIESPINKGLANSIIEGVSSVLRKHGKAIVLEDDLITSPNFLSFMNQSLDYYEQDKRIISVTGYTHAVDIPQGYDKDVFFTKRMSSYGWGTWLDRWEDIDWEMKDYPSFKYNLIKNLQFMKGGEDLPRMLGAYMKGKINSWAVRFCYHQYKTGTYTVYPTQSKIDNIGFGEEGTNTKRRKAYDVIHFEPSDSQSFVFDKEPKLNKTINKSFLKKYSNVSRILANYFLK